MKFALSSAAMLGARDNQEDAIACFMDDGDKAALMIVADGMGGYEGGEIASALAVETFTDTFQNQTRGTIPMRLKIALVMANHAIAERIQADPELDGMGTTLLAAHASSAGLYWASLGDSPLLLVRDGVARQLNDDHSMTAVIERQLQTGLLTPEEAAQHPERGALLAHLGGLHAPDMLDCPTTPAALQQGDRIIAASDGLMSLSMDDIAKTCASATDLLAAVTAKAVPHQDNASLIVLAAA